jgi:mannose-6-phosphate isomerase
MEHGHRVLEEKFRRADGLYRTRPADETVDLYDQAFVLLAQSALGGGAGRAEALLALLPTDPTGGFAELDGEARLANPNMHLLEAFLAWDWRDAAAGQARLALRSLIDPETGAVSEAFAPGWRAPEQRRVEPGHQFEWAWLLMRHAAQVGDGAALAAGLRLLELGERSGVDRNVAVNALDETLSIVDPGTRLWPQTERLRAHLLAGLLTGDSGCWNNARRASAGLTLFLTEDGQWIDSLEGDDRSAPASSLYHIVGAIAQLDEAVKG